MHRTAWTAVAGSSAAPLVRRGETADALASVVGAARDRLAPAWGSDGSVA